MNTAVIYKIRNVVNQKFYVGSTIDKKRRFRQHRRLLRRNAHHCKHLQAAWNKYGEDCFKFEVVECPIDESLVEAENRWLHEHFGKPYCYNAGSNADSPMRGKVGALHPQYGTTVSDEQKAKVSAGLKKFYAENPEQHPRLGKAHTAEALQKIKENRTAPAGKNHYRYGKTVSDEVRAKISATQKGRPSPHKGKKMSEQGRANVAAAVKRGPDSPFYGKRPANAEDMMKAVTAVPPNAPAKTFPSLSQMRDELGISIATIIRACKSGKPIRFGQYAGWTISYGEQSVCAVDIPSEYAHLPRSRAQAKREGSDKYFTGQPCKRGHIGPRATKGTCILCRREDEKLKRSGIT